MVAPDPQYIACNGTCTVVVTHELSLPPLQLDEAAGASIAGAILAIWAVGWAFRVLIRTLRHSDGVSTSESE